MTTLSVSQAQFLEGKLSPERFQDGLISRRHSGMVEVTFLNGEVKSFRLFEAPVDQWTFPVGEPVAHHPFAGIICNGDIWASVKESIVE